MVWVIFLYVDTVFGFYGYSFVMLSWMFQHDSLIPAVLSVLYACFVFLYLQLLSATEHVSHGKAI